MQSVAITTDKDNRLNFKNKLLSKVEASLTPPTLPAEVESEAIEIIDKYSTWVPAGFALESEELLPDFQKEEPYIPQHELEERATVKRGLLNKVEESLIPVEVVEPESVEIIDRYANWAPARLSLEPQDTLLPEITEIETSISPWEAEKRDAIEAGLLNQVDTSPVVEPAPKPIEIIEKYSKGIPARFSTETDEPFFPESNRGDTSSRDGSFTPHSELEKRSSFKDNLLNRIEAAIVPEPTAIEPVPVEIVEKYSQWVPSRLSLEPQDGLLPEFQTQEPVLSPYELEKKQAVLAKADQVPVIKEAVEPSTPEIEVIEKYSNWAPARLAIEPEDKLLPEPVKEEPFIPHRELEKRVDIKNTILDKVENSLTPKTPETKPEVTPIEIIEKYSNWAPSRISMEPEDRLLPEPKREEVVITPREAAKRVDIKQAMMDKFGNSLIPEESEPEVVPIEIIEKYAHGLPKIDPKPMDPIFSDETKSPYVPQGDISKRITFKDNLSKKISSLPSVVPEKEIVVGEYSQRVVTPYGLDFNDIKLPSLQVSELQETIVDFVPVIEEPVIPVLRIPENHGELDERALYGVLIRNSELQHTSETANLTLDVLAGRSSRAVEFVVIEIPKQVKVQPTPVKKKEISPVIETKSVEAKVTVAESVKILEPFDFDLPSDWSEVPLATLRTDLLSTGATPEQVDAKMASLVEKTNSPVVDETMEENFTIDLPEEFKSWKPTSQYLHLTKERKLTPEQANAVIWEFNLEN